MSNLNQNTESYYSRLDESILRTAPSAAEAANLE
jgi:hypothetical protein